MDEAINELKAEIEELSEITAEEIKTNQSELESHTKNNVVHITNDERKLWNDKYTKVEIDNKFSAFETNIDWKEAVNTYNDIATTYPNPEDGWTVSAKDDDCIYRYNGTGWVEISASVIPKATSSNDGLLSKENYSKLFGISSGAEVNQNAFSNVVVGSTTITADAKTDTLTLVAGDNVTITSDENSNKITISIAEYAPLSETETDALM